MKSRRLGCLTGAGLLAAALTLLLVSGVFVLRGGRMFSPGPLHAGAGGGEQSGVTSHADTGGDCAACHTAPWDPTPMAQRCLDCHSDIAADLTDATTLHGALQSQGADMDCRQCHTEHRGPAASLTFVDMDTFPHDTVGFSLAGHSLRADSSPFDCQDCHTESLARFDALTCDACHRQDDPAFMQAHVVDFGTDCLACHDGIDSYARDTFDHSLTAFPLTGRHEAIQCAECHIDQTLRGTPTECAACHVEPAFHAGAFSATCADCHSTAAWQPARFDQPHTFPFDHGDAGVNSCRTCHIGQVQSYTCYECHDQSEIAEEHSDEGITDFQDCTRCHPTGQEDEAEDRERGGD